MDNIPMPVGCFVYGKLNVNVMIPVPFLRFPQFIIERTIGLMSPPSSTQTDSRKILPSFNSDIDVVTPLPPREDSSIPSTAELHQLLNKSSGQSSYHASSGICSTAVQDAEISCKETCPSIVLQSTEERKTENIAQNSKSETEGRVIVQTQSSFFLPSIRIGNISYPVGLSDPIWRLPNPTFCIAGIPDSSLKLCNPLHVAGRVHTVQTMATFEKENLQSAPILNFDSNELTQAEKVTILQMNEQPLDPTKITGKSDLEIHEDRPEFETSLAIDTENEFAAFPSPENSNAITLTEQRKQRVFNTLPSNEISEIFLKHDKVLAAFSTDISSSGVQELSGVQLQPVCAVSTPASGKNDCLQTCTVDCRVAKAMPTGEVRQKTNFLSPHQIPSTTQIIPEYFGLPNISPKLQTPLHKRSAQSSEENEYPQSGNSSSVLVNDKRNEEINSIPLFIDTSTTQKMEKLLKPIKNSSSSSPTFVDVDYPMQNSYPQTIPALFR